MSARGSLIGWLTALVVVVASWLVIGGLSAAGATIAVLALYFAIAGASFNFLYRSLGVFSLMQPVFIACGGYTAVYLYNNHGISPWLSLVIAPFVAAVVAVPVALAAVRAGTGAVLTALVTLIISEAAFPVLASIKQLGGAVGLYVNVAPTPTFWDMQFVQPQTYARLLLILNVVVIAFLVWWQRSKFGFFTTAIKDSPEAAAAVGIPTARLRILTFVISAMIASLAGVIYAQYNLLATPSLFLGDAALFEVIVVALVGGVARPWGALVGALVIAYINNEVTNASNGRQGVAPLVFAAIFVVIALVIPRGISGTWAIATEKLKDTDLGRRALSVIGRPTVPKPTN